MNLICFKKLLTYREYMAAKADDWIAFNAEMARRSWRSLTDAESFQIIALLKLLARRDTAKGYFTKEQMDRLYGRLEDVLDERIYAALE
jgi:hypothetical protein